MLSTKSPAPAPLAQQPLDLPLRAEPVTPAFASSYAHVRAILVRPGVVLLARKAA